MKWNLRRQLWASAAAVWMLSSMAWAAPRVAIVTPMGGEVWLGGVRLTAPRLAEEGQELTIAAGGSARLQLLGSNKERQVKGDAHLVISKANLEKDSKTVARGTIAVSDEIGSIKQAAASSARWGSVDFRPIGFALELPPIPFEGGYKVRIATPIDKLDLSPDNKVSLTLKDMTDPSSPELAMDIDTPAESLDFPAGMLVEQHRYELIVQGRGRGYRRSFELRSEAEQAELRQTASQIAALEGDRFAILLRLANFYRGFDQTSDLANVLLEVVADPQYQKLDYEEQKTLAVLLNDALQGLDRETLPEPKEPPDATGLEEKG